MTPEEYLILEDACPYRNEFYDGAMLAMQDRTYRNALIHGNLLGHLHFGLRDTPWEFFSSSMRVLIPSLPLYTYPDASIVHRPARTATHSETTLVDPVLIVEVLSPPGESYERRATFQQFQKLPTLLHYVTVSQEFPRVDYYWRTGESAREWPYLPHKGLNAVLTISSMGIKLSLSDIYERVEFPLPDTTLSRKHPDHDRII